MADAPKILATSLPGAALTAMYTCPGATSCVARLLIANQAAASRTFRVALSPLGAGITGAHYIAYDVAIGPNEPIEFKGLCFQATDVLRVYASAADVSFVLDGVEIT